MAFPEKVSYPEKYNLRPIVDPDGQFSAENANHIKEKINKNALFHGVHDNLSALQAAHTNPPVGAFAYLIDGSHYRCVNIGWTTNESEGGSNYFKGYHPTLPALRLAHPSSTPGSRAIIKVVGANDQEALWDEDGQDWFAFEVIAGGVSADQYQALKLGSDNLPFLDLRAFSGGGSTALTAIHYFNSGYESGLKYQVTAAWTILGESFGSLQIPVKQEIILAPADAVYSRLDVIVLNIDGSISKITGVPSENPVQPDIDPNTQILATFILVQANALVPDGVNQILVYDENAGTAGGEWNAVEDTAGVRINLASTVNLKTGTKSIEATNTKFYDTITFTPGAPLATGGLSELSYYIKNKASNDRNSVFLRFSGEDKKGKFITTSFRDSSYDPLSINWQFNSIGLSFLTSNFSILNEVEFVSNGFPNDQFGFFLDTLKLTSGTEAVSGNYVTQPEFTSALALKVDKVAGKQLSTEDYSTAEKTKLANVIELHKGTYTTITDLRIDFPEGAGQAWHQNRGGWTGDVDAGANANAVRYLWDTSDLKWVIQLGETTAETAESIRTKYLSNPGVEEFTTTLKNKLDSITAIFTTALKTAYDSASTWVTTNGQNVLDRLGVLERAPIIVSTSRLLAATDHNRILLITATVTLTWPAGGIANFNVNFDVDASGTLTIAEGTAGEVNAPDGKILEAGKMGHAYRRPDNGKLRLKGIWKV